MLIAYYTTAVGAQPVRKYIEALEVGDRAKVDAALIQIGRHGIEGSAVNVRPIKGKLWELKVDAQRVFYVVVRGPMMVLLHAYRKQSEKAPQREIDTAVQRFKDITGKKP